MNKQSMKCWICGDIATSGEHRIKHSDLKYLYPDITQKSPLYHRKNGVQKRPIGSIKSDHLKFDALLCGKCNNERTQKHDKSWEKLSNYLQKNWNNILNVNKIDLPNVFPNDTIENMINVQLFFVKIFGTKIVESCASIDISSFSKSILENIEHPNIYMAFMDSEIKVTGRYSSISDIEVFTETGTSRIVYAHMFYTIGRITVDLIYSSDESLIDLNGALKPTKILCNQFELSKLNYKTGLPQNIQSLWIKNDTGKPKSQRNLQNYRKLSSLPRELSWRTQHVN